MSKAEASTAETAHKYKLTAYPKELCLQDGTRVVLRPMAQEDGDALLEFFLRIPGDERYYLKEDVTSPKVTGRWARELDYDRALPLLAWADDRVVADGTLHRNRAGAHRHVGELRIVVDSDYRNRGLGTMLMRELEAIANETGLERLVFKAVVEKESQAIHAAEFVGFA